MAIDHRCIKCGACAQEFHSNGEAAGDWNAPINYEIGRDANVKALSRSLKPGGLDFILLVPALNGELAIEATGNQDAYLELYNADTEEFLAEDNGGIRAKILYNVKAGQRYMAIRSSGLSSSLDYDFRAYIQAGDNAAG